MLVLSRVADEEVYFIVGDVRIVLKVVEFRGEKVRLGITAPESVIVHRREVYEAIERGEVRNKRKENRAHAND